LSNRFKLSGQLPLLSVQISDQKLKSILELVDSIPKAESTPATSSPPKITEVRLLKIISLILFGKINSYSYKMSRMKWRSSIYFAPLESHN